MYLMELSGLGGTIHTANLAIILVLTSTFLFRLEIQQEQVSSLILQLFLLEDFIHLLLLAVKMFWDGDTGTMAILEMEQVQQ